MVVVVVPHRGQLFSLFLQTFQGGVRVRILVKLDLGPCLLWLLGRFGGGLGIVSPWKGPSEGAVSTCRDSVILRLIYSAWLPS